MNTALSCMTKPALVFILTAACASVDSAGTRSKNSPAPVSDEQQDADAAAGNTPTENTPPLSQTAKTGSNTLPPIKGFEESFLAEFQGLPTTRHFIGSAAELVSESTYASSFGENCATKVG
jgi:hypothetical protein